MIFSFFSSIAASSFLWATNSISPTPKRNSPQTFHKKSTSRLGGIAIFLGVLFGILQSQSDLLMYPFNFILLVLPFFIVGFLDDIAYRINPVMRLFLMLPAPILIFYVGNLQVTSVNLWLIDYFLSFEFFALLFLVFAFLGIANAFNIVDGFNGLLPFYCLTICAPFIFGGYEPSPVTLIFSCIFYSLVGFLWSLVIHSRLS